MDTYLETWLTKGIEVTEEQKNYARKINEEEFNVSRENGIPDAPIRDDMSSKKMAWIGNLGEVIFADYFNIERPYKNDNPNEDGDDGGWDFFHQGYKIQVKTTDYLGDHRNLLIQERLLDETREKVDRIVLMQYDKRRDIAHIPLAMSVDVFFELSRYKNLSGRPAQGVRISRMERIAQTEDNHYCPRGSDTNAKATS